MRIKLLILFFCWNVFNGFAQELENSRIQANSIKKNSEYIYGEAAGDDENECYEMAKEKLMTKVQSFIDNHPDLSAADGVIIENIQSKTKKLTYERSIRIKVVCVYVNKVDILPLYKQESKVVEKALEKENIMSTPLKKGEVVEMASKEEVVEIVEKSIKDKKQEIVMENTETVITEVVDKTSMKANYEQNKDIVFDSQRENEIISTIMKMHHYDEIYNYLEKEKNSKYDVRYKLVKAVEVDNCFWLIFDSNRKLVAVFDKKYSEILNIDVRDWNSYKNYPKMWIHVYE